MKGEGTNNINNKKNFFNGFKRILNSKNKWNKRGIIIIIAAAVRESMKKKKMA